MAIKSKQPLEAEIQKAILDWLQLLENQGRLIFKRNNAGMRFGEYKGKNYAIKLGVAGSPDIELVVPVWNDDERIIYGQALAIEVKRPGQKLRENQEAYRKKFEDVGGVWLTAHSLDEVVEFLK